MRRARLAIITASAVFFLFVTSDLMHFGLAWPLPGVLALRASALLFGVLVLLALRGPPRPARFDRLMFLWTAWAALLTAVILPATRPTGWILHGFVVCTSIPAVYLLFPLPFLGALVIGCGMAVGYLAFVIVTNADLTIMQGTVITISLSASNLFGAVAARTHHQTTRASFLQGRALAEAKRLADAASRAKSELLATVSHEVRTPLHGVLGAVQLLERGALAPDAREHVGLIRRSAGGMLELVDHILEFARTDAGALRSHAVSFDASTLVRELAAMVTPRARGGLALHVDPALPPLLVGDAGRLRRVLLNLVDNAVKYGDASPIGVIVTIVGASGNEIRARFAVDNGGPPIPEAVRSAPFDPFVQRDPADGTTRRGFGLGLAIARRDVEAMGGTLTLGDDAAGRTVFGFELVLAVPERGPEPAAPPLEASPARPARAMSLLIVEDDPVSARIAQAFLAQSGHRTQHAGSGPDAVRAATSGTFDAVLMDMRLPGFDGLEATRQIRACPDRERARVPIVATTANALPEERARYLAEGVTAIVPKPIDFAALEATLAGVMPDLPRADIEAADRVAPVIDEAVAQRIGRALGAHQARELMALAITTGAPLVQEIADAHARADLVAVARAAHRLASAAHSAAFARLGGAAADLESRARAGQATVDALESVRAAWDAARAAYAALGQTVASSPPSIASR